MQPVQVNDRVQMHFQPDLCPEAFQDGLASTSSQPYPFGVDPTWHGTRTELQFLNSVKMKLSILLGKASRQSMAHFAAPSADCISQHSAFNG